MDGDPRRRKIRLNNDDPGLQARKRRNVMQVQHVDTVGQDTVKDDEHTIAGDETSVHPMLHRTDCHVDIPQGDGPGVWISWQEDETGVKEEIKWCVAAVANVISNHMYM